MAMNVTIAGHPAVGSIVPIGVGSARWMYVSRVTESTDGSGYQVYWGRVWSARSQRWTKHPRGCARVAVGKQVPRCPRPRVPQD